MNLEAFAHEFARRMAGPHDWVNAIAMPIVGGGTLVQIFIGPEKRAEVELFVNLKFAENYRAVVAPC